MGVEPGPGSDGVVVADDEHAMVGIGPQRVDSRVERVASVQPPDPGLMAFRAAANAHARVSDQGCTHAVLRLTLCVKSNHVITMGWLSRPRQRTRQVVP